MLRLAKFITLAAIMLAALVFVPVTEAQECTWRGTAPFCSGECRAGEEDVRRDKSGNGAVCWTGSKVLCCEEQAPGAEWCRPGPVQSVCIAAALVCDNGCKKFVCGVCFGFTFSAEPASTETAPDRGTEYEEKNARRWAADLGFENARIVGDQLARVTREGETFYLVGGVEEGVERRVDVPVEVPEPAVEPRVAPDLEPPADPAVPLVAGEGVDVPAEGAEFKKRLEQVGLSGVEMVPGYVLEVELGDGSDDPVYVIVGVGD